MCVLAVAVYRAVALAPYVARNPHLCSLTLQYNSLADQALHALSGALNHNNSLRRLDLSFNNEGEKQGFTASAVAALCTALSNSNQSVLSLSLERCLALKDREYKLLADMIKVSGAQHIRLARDCIPDTHVPVIRSRVLCRCRCCAAWCWAESSFSVLFGRLAEFTG